MVNNFRLVQQLLFLVTQCKYEIIPICHSLIEVTGPLTTVCCYFWKDKEKEGDIKRAHHYFSKLNPSGSFISNHMKLYSK